MSCTSRRSPLVASSCRWRRQDPATAASCCSADVPALVQMITAKPGLKDLALTTNGVLLADQADALKSAGLGRITVSLDTLHRIGSSS